MNSKSTIFLNRAMRYVMALTFSLLLITAAQLETYAQTTAPAYVDLDAVQLDQLVAPVALDPDSLVAQILTASTYPDQVAAADTWSNQNMNLPPDQRAAGANNMSWDPAVKGLIEFPAALDNLAKNSAWTSQLGNAYYNQPGDVMNAVQAMRLQALQSNVLVTTPQQRVVVVADLVEVVPVNPAVIYVPYYNPWRIWGALFVSYPGFVVLPPPSGMIESVGLAFDPGIAVDPYVGFGWGFGAWAPAWDGGTVLFNNSTYISDSVTVCNHGYFGGHDRGVFEHGGRGVPGGFHAHAHAGAARNAAARAGSGHGRASAGHSAYANRRTGAGHQATRSSHGTATANRGRTSASHGTTTASRGGASANRGTATANRGRSAASHGSTTASRGGTSSNRGTATANRGGSSASHGSTTASRGAASTGRGTATANRGSSSASHGSATANRGGSSSSHGSVMANRGGASGGHSAPAGHSGGGHAAGGRGRSK